MTRIDVCVCTYRRDSLIDTLASIAAQVLDDVAVRVIVADNDENDARRDAIEHCGDSLRLNLHYLHAPSQNISIARNACLNAATADWIAFIDDDEIAEPTWLARLLEASSDRDVVFGVSQAIYGPDIPNWITRADLHSNRLDGRDAPWNGYTSNVLISRRFCLKRGLKFDRALGQTGGEDTLFFFEAMQAGARFGYVPSAIVTEITTSQRASLKWLLMRRFRSGQTHALILRRQGKQISATASAIAKLGWSLTVAALTWPRPSQSARYLVRGALHAGVVAAAAGIAPYKEYGATHAGRS